MTAAVNPTEKVGSITWGGLEIPVLRGQGTSFFAIERLKDMESALIKVYQDATGDERWDVDPKLAYDAIAYRFIEEWYGINEVQIPEDVYDRIHEAVRLAKESHAGKKTNGDTERALSFNKFVLKSLAAGRPEEEILEDAEAMYSHIKNRKTTFVYLRNRFNKGMYRGQDL